MPAPDHCQGITPTDLQEMRRIFDDHSPTPILRKAHAFHWDPTTDSWQIYRVPNIETSFTLIAHRDEAGAWIED